MIESLSIIEEEVSILKINFRFKHLIRFSQYIGLIALSLLNMKLLYKLLSLLQLKNFFKLS